MTTTELPPSKPPTNRRENQTFSDLVDDTAPQDIRPSIDDTVETGQTPGRKLSFGIACAALVLVGMVFGASLWILAGIAVAVIVALNAFLARTWSTTTFAVRTGADTEVKVGSLIPITLQVVNHGSIPVLWILVEDLLPRWGMGGMTPPLEVEGERVAVMMLMPGETRDLQYSIRCRRRGYFQVGPTVLETGDMMGLFRRYRVGTQPQYVTVLPDVQPLSGYEVGSRRPIGEIRMRENVMDDPTRLRGIRRWQPGDPMRSIHWAATARTGTLHSKIFEPSSIAGATLILDLHTSTNPDQHEPARSDLAVTTAASIAGSIHDLGEPFALATNGRDAADRIRTDGWVGDHRVRDAAIDAAAMHSESDRMNPVVIDTGRGPLHLKEVVRQLARLDRTNGLTLAEFLAETESQLSRETTLLVIVQRCTHESIAALVGMARRGWAVGVIVSTHDINDYSASAGPLIAERIPTFHLAGADSITDICRQTLMR